MVYTQTQIDAIEHILTKKINQLRNERNEIVEFRTEIKNYTRTHREIEIVSELNVLQELQQELHDNSLGKSK